jgi:hypothetical protein
MLQFPPIPLGPIEEYIAAAVIIAWGCISAGQLIGTKLHRQRCILCERGVRNEEQAHAIHVPCHARCYYLAKLVGTEVKSG